VTVAQRSQLSGSSGEKCAELLRHAACDGVDVEGEPMLDIRTSICTLALLTAMPSIALAGPIFGSDDATRDGSSETAQPKLLGMRPGFGARVGGYGFRRTDGSSEKWDDCRMNGIGLFGTLDMSQTFFTSLGVDLYHAAPSAQDEGMDRDSTHLLVGAGARMFPEFVMTPYVELGGGAEWTRIDLGSRRTARVFPVGFIGLGAELNVTRELKLGAALRVLSTTQPDVADSTTSQGLGTSQAALTADGGGEVATRTAVAMQGQFFLRYAL
jgi:hypothetical protein